MAIHGVRRVRRAVVLLAVTALAATCGATIPAIAPGWISPGLVGGGGWPFASEPVSPDEAAGAYYLPRSSVLALPGGRARLIPLGDEDSVVLPARDPRVAEAVRADRTWLAQGRVPGRTGEQHAMATRALLDLRLLTRPNGASTASWYGAWNHVWPRDAAFTVAAFAATGHTPEARRVLRFLARAQNDDGLWAARYDTDGTAVADGRRAQLDALGWTLWAAWFLHEEDRSGSLPGSLPELWPMVRKAADRAAASLDADGLPPPSSDYWERSPSGEQDPRRPTLGVVAPILAGLRGAAALATDEGMAADAERWGQAARRLSDGITRLYGSYGYPRSPVSGGAMDAAVTFLGPPFGPPDPAVEEAVHTATERLRLPGGGVIPGERWPGDPVVAWTPETALFALNAAASGQAAEADGWLGWLAAHRTPLGVLPEKVDSRGRPAAVAPLGWTASIVLLALEAGDRPLPRPPAA